MITIRGLEDAPMVFTMRYVELHVAVEARIALQPSWLSVDLVQDSEKELLCGYRSVEDAQSLFVGEPRVGPGFN